MFNWLWIFRDGGDVVVFAVMVSAGFAALKIFIVVGLDDVRTFRANVTELITVKTLFFCPF